MKGPLENGVGDTITGDAFHQNITGDALNYNRYIHVWVEEKLVNWTMNELCSLYLKLQIVFTNLSLNLDKYS